MIENQQQLELLIAFADGVATAEQRVDAEVLIHNDPAAAHMLESLRATNLPYQRAYNQLLVAAPERIRSLIAGSDPEATIEPADAPSGTGSGRAVNIGNWLAMAACLLLGVIAGVAATGVLQQKSQPQVAESQHTEPRWVQLIADYHSLYVRNTITMAAAQTAGAVQPVMSSVLGGSLLIPDLMASGYQFRRAQQLGIGNSPLVQLAYLPYNTGEPLAVCVLRRDNAETIDLKIGQRSGIHYAYWQNGKYAVAMVGSTADRQFAALAQKIYRNGLML